MGLFSRNKGQQTQQPQQASREPPAVASPALSVTGSQRPDASQLSQSQYQQQLFYQHYQALQPHQNALPQQQAQQQQLHAQQQAQPQQQGHNTVTSPAAPPAAYAPPYPPQPYVHPYAHPYRQHPYQPQVYTAIPMMLDHTAAAAVGAAGAAHSGGGSPYGTGPAGGGGAAAHVNGGGGSTALLYQAAQQAANSGKPLTLDFVGQLQPLAANHQYGITMPHEHPYGPPPPMPMAPHGEAAPPPLPPGWQPGMGQNPYDSIRIPALPDMRSLPPELQDFRDQCATGVRQAVAMITAMEHQLWWERSRRQQAEEDCKVLLAAVHTERGLAEDLAAAEERRRREAAEAGAKLTLAADELPQATEAATTIQKHIRGRLARKEFESHLRDILRGVDPALDPAGLPPAAAAHVSHVNAGGAPRRLGLRQLLGDAGGSPSPGDAASATAYYRRQVERIGQRLAGHKDAGEPHPSDTSGDPLHADVKQLLSGTYPASSAQVIAALVRRCRELQSALLEAAGQLEEAQLSVQGLRDANAKLAELAEVRSQLQAARAENLRLAGSVAKLRAALAAVAAGRNADAAAENPWVAAWYRKAYADKEWQRVPPGGPGGVALLDGPDDAVETWDDLRASLPEPVMLPRTEVPGRRYKDLMQLKQDMIAAARAGPPDPLYTMPVPDTSTFRYERDTPLVPLQSAAPLIRESMHPDAFVGLHEDLSRGGTPRPSAPGSAPGSLLPSSAIRPHPPPHPDHQHRASPRGPQGQSPSPSPSLHPGGSSEGGLAGPGAGPYSRLLEQQEQLRRQAEWEAAQQYGGGGGGDQYGGAYDRFWYNQDTPVVPVYSVLPLIREDEYVRRSMSPGRDASPPRTPPPPPSPPPPTPQSQPQPHPAVVAVGAAAMTQPHAYSPRSSAQQRTTPDRPSGSRPPSSGAGGAAAIAVAPGPEFSPPGAPPDPYGLEFGYGQGYGYGYGQSGHVSGPGAARPATPPHGAGGAGGQPSPRGVRF